MNTQAQDTNTVDLETLLQGIAQVPQAPAAPTATPIFSAPAAVPAAAPIFSAPAAPTAPTFSAPAAPAAPTAPTFSAPAPAVVQALAPDIVETVIAKVEGEQALQQSYNAGGENIAGATPTQESPTPEEGEAAAPTVKATRRRALSDQISLIKNQAPVSVSTLVDALPVKQQEKARNLLAFLQSGVKPSVYAEIALKMLVTKGTLTSAELRAELMTKYSEGTANSQTQQMMHVLAKLGCAVGNGKQIALAKDSLIVDKFQAAFMQSL